MQESSLESRIMEKDTTRSAILSLKILRTILKEKVLKNLVTGYLSKQKTRKDRYR